MAGGEKNVFLKTWDRTVKVHKENLKLYWSWIYERQNIWYKRFVLKLPPPWTSNKILRDYKFTNVYRELDKNTIWIINNVCKTNNNPVEKLFQVMVTRLFNNPFTFEKIGIPTLDNFNRNKFYRSINDISKTGNNSFTNAYLVHSGGIKGYGRNDFYSDLVELLHGKIKKIYKRITQGCHSLEEVCNYLSTFPSIGSFVAYEISLDLIYAKLIPYTEDDWCNIGPGCRVGMMLLFPSLSNSEHYEKMCELRNKHEYYFDKYRFNDFKYLKENGKNKFTLRVIENGCCEFSKYWKMIHGIGKQRMKFKEVTKVNYIVRKPR